ncbi:ABC transporter permease [Frankia sp. CNm7]|uniref:ABC transporter permease n=1 Tax=Frankia nepalensis TaxID=1836974 RepID=A0A937REF7_9ACTN|nr:ABC transporter permease [Frankia nepalensis]MBL7508954.1 ABC transporter permease [Frankia nepalensis]MBL7516794.1 ABC transporter permease [Frankia nepalensis]MBL7628732.1 ABC transporter permease [Frankia nepalensis]
MTLVKVERIKLFSTRSPWWCIAAAMVLTVGFVALAAGLITDTDAQEFTAPQTQGPYRFGFMIMMIMAVLAVTTEYRFGTIRATFLAVPNRTSALLAKAAVIALVAAAVGEVAGVASWGLAKAIRGSEAPLDFYTARDYRVVFGVGLYYLVAAVFAVAIGVLIRQSAGAIALVLLWPLLVENLILIIPRVGDDIQKWLPFTAGNNFLAAGTDHVGNAGDGPGDMPFGPWGSLVYFAVITAALLALALVTAKRRDA